MKRFSFKIGENAELLAELNSEYRDRRKDAVKRVIANMTVGKDVSGLFPQVVKNMQTEDLEMVRASFVLKQLSSIRIVRISVYQRQLTTPIFFYRKNLCTST